MSLPLILDLAIGLIFIYLILSLLSSEVHELITTLLQWRAKHLKESIEGLLAGNNTVDESVRELTNHLYDDPLIKSLNHEAKGLIASFFRKFTYFFGDAFDFFTERISGVQRTFGDKRSGPSYIPSETFSTTLIETLKLDHFYEKMIELRLRKFTQDDFRAPIQKLIDELRERRGDGNLLQFELELLDQKIEGIISDFTATKTTLESTVDRISDQLKRLRVEAKELLPDQDDIIHRRLTVLQQTTFEDKHELNVLMRNLRPTISEVIHEFNQVLELYQSIRFIEDESGDYDAILGKVPPDKREQLLQLRGSFNLFREFMAEMQKQGQNYTEVLNKVPPYLRESLPVLARRAESKVQDLSQSLGLFRGEVETWFDNSMERASGVYKRNAKGVAIIIGFLVAVAANADTFHIIGRLSKDTVLRNSIVESAGQVATAPGDISAVREQVNRELERITLPIGWNSINLEQQTAESANWFFPPLRQFLGWLLSGIAISMGATFWFDLLGKIVNVRNSGKSSAKAAGDSPKEEN